MKVYVVHVITGGLEQLAGVFEKMNDAYGYLKINNLIGTVRSMELIK